MKRFVKLLFSPLLLMVHLHTANGNIISRQKPLFHFGKITDGRTSEGDDGKSRKALGKPLGRLIHKSELQDQHLAAASLLIQLLTIHVVTWRWTEKWMLHLPFVQLWYAYYVRWWCHCNLIILQTTTKKTSYGFPWHFWRRTIETGSFVDSPKILV